DVAELTERLANLRRPYETRLRETRLAAIPEAIRADTQAAIATPSEKRNEVQKDLAAKFESSLRVTAEQGAATVNAPDRSQAAERNARIAALRATRRTPEKLQAMYDVGPPPPTYLLKRGNYETPGEEVQPGFLSMLCERSSTIAATHSPSTETSGRRLAL